MKLINNPIFVLVVFLTLLCMFNVWISFSIGKYSQESLVNNIFIRPYLDFIKNFIYLTGFTALMTLILKRQVILALTLLFGYIIFQYSFYIKPFVDDDRIVFYNRAHADNVAYYRQNEEILLKSIPNYAGINGIKWLGKLCKLKLEGCGCWLFIDQATSSGLSSEYAAWHHPKAPILLSKNLLKVFYKVSVERINFSTYSVLSCEYDESLI